MRLDLCSLLHGLLPDDVLHGPEGPIMLDMFKVRESILLSVKKVCPSNQGLSIIVDSCNPCFAFTIFSNIAKLIRMHSLLLSHRYAYFQLIEANESIKFPMFTRL